MKIMPQKKITPAPRSASPSLHGAGTVSGNQLCCMCKDSLSAAAKAPFLCTGGHVRGVTCATLTASPNAEAPSTWLRAQPWSRDALWRWSTVLLQTDCLFIPQVSNPKPSLKSKLQTFLVR